MSLWFWSVAGVLHLIVGGPSLALAWCWRRHLAPRKVLATGLAWIVVEAVGLVGVALCGAVVLARFLPDGRFAAIRFLAQAVFGEGFLLLLWLTWLLSRRGARWLTTAGALILAALLTIYWDSYHREPFDLKVRHHTLDRSRGRDSRTLRILHLSDIQVWRVGPYEERIVRAAVEQRPDIILMTGDYVQTRLTPDYWERAAELRDLLRREGFAAPLGIHAVPGDVDGDGVGLFDGLGVRWLRNESRVIDLPGGRRMTLVGLARDTSRRRGGRSALDVVREAPAGDLFVVMGHGPDFVSELAGRVPVDLALAGHTHGGQIVLPFFGPPLTLTRLPRRYAAGGLNDYAGVALHVSRGAGMERGSAPQIRFLCPPEICLIEMRY
jgi:predicted MPP superfamily phosphohydrolase